MFLIQRSTFVKNQNNTNKVVYCCNIVNGQNMKLLEINTIMYTVDGKKSNVCTLLKTMPTLQMH